MVSWTNNINYFNTTPNQIINICESNNATINDVAYVIHNWMHRNSIYNTDNNRIILYREIYILR